MFQKLSITLVLIFCCLESGIAQTAKVKRYRLCVPDQLFQDCEKMRNELADKGGRIDCVRADDKIGCIEKVAKGEADVLPLDPEEIFVASEFQKSAFAVIAEIRSTEYKERDFRYEPVAVIRNSAGINSISDLKGKRSCHTGFGRNAGWKVPFSHLMDKDEISGYCNDIEAPTVEKDMHAVSQYFGSACAPGKWVTEDDLDRSLKQKYSNLCKLCKQSDCSDKDGDGYVGYGGALLCLTQNDGDVAWTKMDAVVKHFQLKLGKGIPISTQFSFLCWDGSSVPLPSENPCAWSKRPWQAFLASTKISIFIPDLQDQLSLHEKTSIGSSAKWRKTVLEMDVDTELYHYPELLRRTYSPRKYLDHANYTITIQKPSCPAKNIRICVESGLAQEKCNALRMAAAGRRIRPGFECVLSANSDCLDMVKRDMADVMFTGPKLADQASKSGMVTILSEVESVIFDANQTGPFRYAVAMVRSDSNITKLQDLRGKKSCHGSISSLAGWNIPLTVLRDHHLIFGPNCELPISIAGFFNESCVPGALNEGARTPPLPKSLCQLCSGDESGLCVNNDEELYYGDKGALNCLKDYVADVAFIDHVTLDTHVLEEETGLKPENIRLLCPTGGQQNYTEFHHCNWGKIPTHKVIARSGENYAVIREDARTALLRASELFKPGSKSEVVFRLFGAYHGNSDLLFRDTSFGLVDDTKSSVVANRKLMQDFDFCETSSAVKVVAGVKFAIFLTFAKFLFH